MAASRGGRCWRERVGRRLPATGIDRRDVADTGLEHQRHRSPVFNERRPALRARWTVVRDCAVCPFCRGCRLANVDACATLPQRRWDGLAGRGRSWRDRICPCDRDSSGWNSHEDQRGGALRGCVWWRRLALGIIGWTDPALDCGLDSEMRFARTATALDPRTEPVPSTRV